MLKPLHAVAHENPVHPGTPDVDCSLGWLELKEDDITVEGTVPLRHLTPQQKLFLHMRRRAGGLAVLLVRVFRGQRQSWFVLDGLLAMVAQDRTLDWWQNQSYKWWPRIPGPGELVACLQEISLRARSSTSVDNVKV